MYLIYMCVCSIITDFHSFPWTDLKILNTFQRKALRVCLYFFVILFVVISKTG